MPSDDRLLDVLERLEEERRNGRSPTVEELCAGCPDLRDEVARAAADLRWVDGWLAGPLPREPVLPALPGYEVLSELGHGGQGVVYLARQVNAKRVVALKMIRAGDHAGADAVARFCVEAEAIARLQHPNVVQIYEVDEHDGRPFFSLEYCGGGSLQTRLNGTPQPSREAAVLVKTLAAVMHVAHGRGIVHRDLKPANVLFAEDGTAKVTDFGLARKLEEAGRTQTGVVLGTPSYMAPEQAGGRTREVGPSADVYALGAVLSECLTGRPPFKGATTLETLKQVCEQEPVPPRQLQSAVPRDLDTVCLKCLEKAPGKRYASAEALAEDLRRFLDGEPVRARPTGPVGHAVRWARRRPAVAALLGLLFAVGAVGFGLVTWKWREADLARGRADVEASDEAEARATAETAEATVRRQNEEIRTKARTERVAAARRLAERGLWDAALPLYDEAVKEAEPEEALALEVERSRRLPDRDQKRLRAEVDRLLPRVGGGNQRSVLLLYKGATTLNELGKVKEGRALVREALERAEGLVPADRDFAHGLLTDSSQEAVEQFRQALAKDVFHHPARLNLVAELLFTGQFDEARRQAALMRDLYRKDPFPDFALAWVAVLEGKGDECRQHLDELAGRLDDRARVEEVRSFFEDLRAFARVAGAIGRGGDTGLNPLRLALQAGPFQGKWLNRENPIGVPVPALSRLYDTFEAMFYAVLQDATVRGDLAAAVKRLDEASERHPEATILYLAANYEVQIAGRKARERDRDGAREALLRAGRLLARARQAPALVPESELRFEVPFLAAVVEAVQLVEGQELLRLQGVGALVAGPAGGGWDLAGFSLAADVVEGPVTRARRGRLAEELPALAAEGRKWPRLRSEKFPALLQALEPEPALELLRRWQQDDAEDPLPQKLRAQTELRAGHHALALQWADRHDGNPRARTSDREAMKAVRTSAVEAMRRLLSNQ